VTSSTFETPVRNLVVHDDSVHSAAKDDPSADRPPSKRARTPASAASMGDQDHDASLLCDGGPVDLGRPVRVGDPKPRTVMASATERAQADSQALDIILEATRALLWISTAADARALAEGVVRSLGGDVMPAEAADGDSVPVDLSFGDGCPVLPRAAPASEARVLLERHLPMLVEDIHRALELGAQADRLAEDASIDSLTTLPNRRMLGRVLGRMSPGDIVIMIDLDHFKRVNDTDGHAAGDRVLRAMGVALRNTTRSRDAVGRYGGEEFVVVLARGSDPNSFLERLRTTWEAERPQPITFSAGIAIMGSDTSSVLDAADAAMYRAKAAGRDRWAFAAAEEPDVVGSPAPLSEAGDRSRPLFVAFSELASVDGEPDDLEVAIRNRLGPVERARGFRSLEVWADLSATTAYAVVSRWDDRESFREHMGSEDLRRSHDRIPTERDRLRSSRLREFGIVST